MSFDALVQESAALDRDLKALKDRLRELASKPELEGQAVEAVRREELAEIEQAVDDIERRSAAVRARIEEWREDPEGALEGLPRPVIGLVRRSWRFGAIVAALPPLIWLGTAGVFYEPGVKMPLFEAAAQVIPILILAAALEGRMFQIGAYPRFPVMQGYYPVYFLVVVAGEIAALWTLGRGEPSGVLFGLTVAGLMNAGFAVVLIALVGSSRRPGSS